MASVELPTSRCRWRLLASVKKAQTHVFAAVIGQEGDDDTVRTGCEFLRHLQRG